MNKEVHILRSVIDFLSHLLLFIERYKVEVHGYLIWVELALSEISIIELRWPFLGTVSHYGQSAKRL